MKIKFYFDTLSPYSYLAWCWLRENREYLSKFGEVILIPITLSALIKANETKGPAEIPSKRDYLMKDCIRKAKMLNLPFHPPKVLPFNSLYAQRISLFECSGDQQWQAIDVFFRTAWEEGKDLGSSEEVEDCLKKNGLPSEKWMEQVGNKVLRSTLKVNTKEAINAGIFGIPSFLVDNGNKQEHFWGQDSISFLKLFLENKDPLNRDLLEKFRDCYLNLDSV